MPRIFAKNSLPLLVAITSYLVLEKVFDFLFAVLLATTGLHQADLLTIFWLYQLLRVLLAFVIGLAAGLWERRAAWAAGAIFGAILLVVQLARDLRNGEEQTWDDFAVGGLIIFAALAPPFAIGCYITQRIRGRRTTALSAEHGGASTS